MSLIESLETRTLFALTPVGGVLTINGTGNNDSFEITQNGSTISLRNLVTNAVDNSVGTVNSLVINLQGGNDYVRLGTLANANQVQLNATIRGGTGNDTIVGGRGNDSLVGEAGNDRLEGKFGADTLDGGDGFDTADYSVRGDALNITIDGSSNDGGTDPAIFGAGGEKDRVLCDAILAGAGADKLTGDNNANYFDGGAGVDSIIGNNGNDTIIGGPGTDSVFGNDGNDFLSARDGTVDQVSDGAGVDTARVDQLSAGDPVNDVASTAEHIAGVNEIAGQTFFGPDGQPLPDYLQWRIRSDVNSLGVLNIDGTDLDDLITIDQFVDAEGTTIVRVNNSGDVNYFPFEILHTLAIHGHGGNDRIIADATVEKLNLQLSGDDGNDLLVGGGNDDEIVGGKGDDILLGNRGGDKIQGNQGRDLLIGGPNGDSLNGGDDQDIVVAGSTRFDSNFNALEKIMAEWTSSRPYLLRVANITGLGFGTRANGSTFLNPLTISEDRATDNINGGAGTDWFFAKVTGSYRDSLFDWSNEIITPYF